MPKNWKTISVTFEINAQKHRDGQFTVPKSVCELLELEYLDDIYLVVQNTKGKTLLVGVFPLRSGTEIYGPVVKDAIKSGQLIRVTASRP